MASFYEPSKIFSDLSSVKKITNVNRLGLVYNQNPQKVDLIENDFYHDQRDGVNIKSNLQSVDGSFNQYQRITSTNKSTKGASQYYSNTIETSPRDQSSLYNDLNQQYCNSQHKNESEIKNSKSQLYLLQKICQQAQTQLKLKTAECNNFKLQNQSLNTVKDQLIELLNKQQNQNRKNLDIIGKHEAKINMLNSQIQKLQEQINCKQSENNNQNQYKQDNLTQRSQKSSFRTTYETQILDISQKQKNLFFQTLLSYKNAINHLQQQKHMHLDLIKNIQTENKRLISQMNNLQQQNAQLKFQLKSLNDQIKESQIYRSELEEKNQEFSKIINSLQESFANTSRLQEQLNTTILSQKNNLQIQKILHCQHFLKRQIQALNQRNSQLLKQITELKIQIGRKQNQQSFYLSNKQNTFNNSLWSPRSSQRSFIRTNSYLANTQDKLNETIFKNHLQVQRYKQAKQKIQLELHNMRSEFQNQHLMIQNLQTQLKQQNIIFQITLKNMQCSKQFEIESLKSQIKNLKNQLNQYVMINKIKNKQIHEKENLLQRWVSQKNLQTMEVN